MDVSVSVHRCFECIFFLANHVITFFVSLRWQIESFDRAIIHLTASHSEWIIIIVQWWFTRTALAIGSYRFDGYERLIWTTYRHWYCCMRRCQSPIAYIYIYILALSIQCNFNYYTSMCVRLYTAIDLMDLWCNRIVKCLQISAATKA